MGGKQKRLTQSRRTVLKKEMTDALVAGTFTTNNRPLDEILDEIDQGIKDDRYPIEVTLDKLIEIWTQAPAPEQAQTAAGDEQGASPAAEVTSLTVLPDEAAQAEDSAAAARAEALMHPVPQGPAGVPGTVEHAQAQAQAAMSPTAQAVLGTGPAIGTGNAIQQPDMLAEATGHQEAIAGAQQVMEAATGIPVTEVGVPAPAEPEEIPKVDLSPITEWVELARAAKKKIDVGKDTWDAAIAQIGDYLDQQAGVDRTKLGHIGGVPVIQRTYVERRSVATKRLLAEHPEIDPETYTDTSSFYKTSLK